MNLLDIKNEKTIIGFIAIYIFFLLFICSRMSPWYFSNEWSDVNLYFNFGKALCNGRVLYTEVFDHKGPFIYFLYGLGYLISSSSFFGMLLIQITTWTIMTFFVYKLAKLYLENSTAYIVSLILPVFLVKLMKGGGSAEEFILVCMVISLYYFVKYYKDQYSYEHRPLIMFVHGILCSIVLLTKLNLLAFWFFPLIGIFLNLLLLKEFKNFALNVLAFFGGILVIAVPILGYLFANDALGEAYSIYIELNSQYAEVLGLGDTISLLFTRISFLFMDSFSLFLMAIVGIFYFPIRYLENFIGKVVFVLSGLSLYTVVYMSPVFHMYYPIPFLVFSILGVVSLFEFIGNYVRVNYSSFGYVFVISLVFLYTGYSQVDFVGSKLMERGFSTNPGLLTQKMHDIINKEKNPTLINLGHGLGNSLFTTCNLMPNVRYPMSPNLAYEAYPDMRDEQIKYIENKKTQFVLISYTFDLSHEKTRIVDEKRQKRKSVKNYQYFMELSALKQNYELIYCDTVKNYIDEYNLEIFRLYKQK